MDTLNNYLIKDEAGLPSDISSQTYFQENATLGSMWTCINKSYIPFIFCIISIENTNEDIARNFIEYKVIESSDKSYKNLTSTIAFGIYISNFIILPLNGYKEPIELKTNSKKTRLRFL